jgi:hypothetical protein
MIFVFHLLLYFVSKRINCGICDTLSIILKFWKGHRKVQRWIDYIMRVIVLIPTETQ